MKKGKFLLLLCVFLVICLPSQAQVTPKMSKLIDELTEPRNWPSIKTMINGKKTYFKGMKPATKL